MAIFTNFFVTVPISPLLIASAELLCINCSILKKKKAVALTSGAHLLNNQNLDWFQSNCQSHVKVGGVNDQRSPLFYILIDGFFSLSSALVHI